MPGIGVETLPVPLHAAAAHSNNHCPTGTECTVPFGAVCCAAVNSAPLALAHRWRTGGAQVVAAVWHDTWHWGCQLPVQRTLQRMKRCHSGMPPVQRCGQRVCERQHPRLCCEHLRFPEVIHEIQQCPTHPYAEDANVCAPCRARATARACHQTQQHTHRPADPSERARRTDWSGAAPPRCHVGATAARAHNDCSEPRPAGVDR